MFRISSNRIICNAFVYVGGRLVIQLIGQASAVPVLFGSYNAYMMFLESAKSMSSLIKES